jgi:hypothetical protein
MQTDAPLPKSVTSAPLLRRHDEEGKSQKGRKRLQLRQAAPRKTFAILMRLLLIPVPSTANGKRLAVPPLEAIVSQLVRKALEGNARAVRALERYKQLASQSTTGGVTVEFVDSEAANSAIGKKDV